MTNQVSHPTTDVLIPTGFLRAALDLAPKGDIRYYLNGAFLNNEGFLDVTNGHYAVRFEVEELKDLPESVVLTRAQLDFYLKKIQLAGGKEGTTITVDYEAKTIVLSGDNRTGQEQIEQGDLKEGRYPELARVIYEVNPDRDQLSFQCLNWDYAALIQKAARRVNKEAYVELFPHRKGFSLWSAEVPGMSGTIMPIRRPKKPVTAADIV